MVRWCDGAGYRLPTPHSLWGEWSATRLEMLYGTVLCSKIPAPTLPRLPLAPSV